MEMAIEYVFIAFWVVYYLWILVVIFTFINIPHRVEKSSNEKISILIPFRNEAKNLPFLIDSLDQLVDKNFEVIFIDDHSLDDSLKVLEKELASVSFKSYVIGATIREGKKAAIEEGVKKANGTIIVQTDADCQVPNYWLSEYRCYFSDSSTDLVFAPVRYRIKNFWSQVLQNELSSLVMVGAAMLKLGLPNMCNGANLGYRKGVFEAVEGYKGNEHIASGDDEFLMHKVFKRNPKSVEFLNSSKSIVVTEPPSSISHFKNQRIRWASKWNSYQLTHVKWLPVLLTIVYCSLILSPWVSSDTVISILFYKLVLEFFMIATFGKFLKVRLGFLSFMVSFLGYPFYLLYFAVASKSKNYTWKKRIITNE